MNIAIIAAMSKSHVIGHQQKLPWHLPADLLYFKKITMGKPIIMGRKTFESIGKILPGRQNIVVTKNKNYHIGVEVPKNASITIVSNFAQALEVIVNKPEEIMIIGGATLFSEALPKASTLYLTYIHKDLPGDVFFPKIHEQDWLEVWREHHQADTANPYDYTFVKLLRSH